MGTRNLTMVVQVDSTTETPSAYWATVEITPEEAQTYLDIMKQMGETAYPGIGKPFKISFIDYSPDWYLEEDCRETEFRPDVGQLNIIQGSLWWSAYEKHTEDLYETYALYKIELEMIAAGEDPQNYARCPSCGLKTVLDHEDLTEDDKFCRACYKQSYPEEKED